MRINPASTIEIVDIVLLPVQSGVGVATEDARRFLTARVGERTLGNLAGKPQPAGVQPVQKTGQGLALRIPFLQLQIEQRAEPVAQVHIIDREIVELMAMHRDVAQALVMPPILLVHAHSHEVRHDFGQAVIVVAFNPCDFDLAFGIGELANVTEKFPVLLFQPAEIKVGEDVTQQNEAAIAIFLKHEQGFARPADVRAQVQVGQDQRVIELRIHNSIVPQDCYGVMNW